MTVELPDRPLFNRFPNIGKRIPFTPLATLPTPCESHEGYGGAGQLVVKRDDFSGQVYSGNKVRKLELLLGRALEEGAKEVLTFGYAGSNHSLATSIYAKQVGLRCISVLLPQPNAQYVRRNLLASFFLGTELHHVSSVSAVALTTARIVASRKIRTGFAPQIIPAGGSSALGTSSFVSALFELNDQIESGKCDAPDRIYVPLGSMGTVAGLAIGIVLVGLKTKVVAVRVVDERFGNAQKTLKLAHKTCTMLHDVDPSFPVIPEQELRSVLEIRDEFFGRQYGEFTPESIEAVRRAREELSLDFEGTYSGKAFSAFLHDAAQGELSDKTAMFWNTHNSRDFTTALSVEADYHDLPKGFHRYFEEDIQALA